jgi:hypothetical protein
VLPELLRRTSLVKIEDEPAGEVCPVSRHSTLRRYFILVGSHRTADPESKATAKTTTKSVNQAHFAPGSHFGEEHPLPQSIDGPPLSFTGCFVIQKRGKKRNWRENGD